MPEQSANPDQDPEPEKNATRRRNPFIIFVGFLLLGAALALLLFGGDLFGGDEGGGAVVIHGSPTTISRSSG